jgi:hypothetical protein
MRHDDNDDLDEHPCDRYARENPAYGRADAAALSLHAELCGTPTPRGSGRTLQRLRDAARRLCIALGCAPMLSGDEVRYFHKTLEEARKALSIVDELAALPVAGRLPLEKWRKSLQDIVAEVRALLRPPTRRQFEIAPGVISLVEWRRWREASARKS